jgi:molecular chaperone DnaJ
MPKDLYAVLGVGRSASADDIKKAYRKLSKEWHPDKHKGDTGVETRFKEINEAYEVLGDPDKRTRYDRTGSTGSAGAGGGPGGGFGGFDFSGFRQGEADFGDMFEGFFGGRRAEPVRAEGSDREVEIEIPFSDVINGARRTLRLRRVVSCSTCEGKGAKKGSDIVTCTNCGGTGQVTRTTQSFFGAISQRSVCDVCAGSGRVPKDPCPTCNGQGRVEETSDVTINIPAGIDAGQVLRIAGEGDAGLRNATPGDLYVRIRVEPDPRFERDGSDIRSVHPISAVDAILGGTATVETVQGTSTLQIPEGTQPNQIFRIRGKGLPHLGRSGHGDHYVTIQVEIPKKLSKQERKVLEEWRSMQ